MSNNNGPYGGGGLGGGMNPATAQNEAPLTPEQQTLLIEAQRVKAMDAGDQDIPRMLPPTEFTGEVMNNGQATQ